MNGWFLGAVLFMTNCNANATNSIAKPMNSIANGTNSIAKTCIMNILVHAIFGQDIFFSFRDENVRNQICIGL